MLAWGPGLFADGGENVDFLFDPLLADVRRMRNALEQRPHGLSVTTAERDFEVPQDGQAGPRQRLITRVTLLRPHPYPFRMRLNAGMCTGVGATPIRG